MKTNEYIAALFIGAMYNWFIGDEEAADVLVETAMEFSHVPFVADA
jgi:hypothetical protein